MNLIRLSLFLVLATVTSLGCGGRPSLYPVTGQVLLGGESYERLIVYMRPVDRPVQPYNLGVGETDQDGKLALRSTDGKGLPTGNYRVSFSCIVNAKTQEVFGLDGEKGDDDRRLITKDIVPFPYSSDDESPVRFEVTSSGENRFEFDIPAS